MNWGSPNVLNNGLVYCSDFRGTMLGPVGVDVKVSEGVNNAPFLVFV